MLLSFARCGGILDIKEVNWTMPRPLRFSYRDALHHVTLRCNNREFLFEPTSQALFIRLLQKTRERFPLSLYNYNVLTNHLHLLFRVGEDDTLSRSMHWLGTAFSREFNKLRGRHGHLWEGRFRSTLVESSTYFFRCMAYVDLNPVRARIVAAPTEYEWSAHRALLDEDQDAIDLHPLYLELGTTRAERYAAYSAMLDEELSRTPVPLAAKHFVGSARFVMRMEERFFSGPRAASLARESHDAQIVSLGPRVGRVITPE
jgi:REP-associated tyrosine transposase